MPTPGIFFALFAIYSINDIPFVLSNLMLVTFFKSMFKVSTVILPPGAGVGFSLSLSDLLVLRGRGMLFNFDSSAKLLKEL